MSAIAALIRKEVRQLLPVIIGLGALTLWSLVDTFILKPADGHSLGDSLWFMIPNKGMSAAFAQLIIGVLIAYGLLPGEHDQRTIEFLYSLPVRRRTVFLVKYGVGCALLLAVNLTGTLEMVLKDALNPSSFQRNLLTLNIVLLVAATDVALSLIVVAYGMLLSFFRRLGWVLFVLVWLALRIAERAYTPLGILNVNALYTVEHHGTLLLVNWRAWQVHGVMAAVALVVAARLWLVRQEDFAAFYEKLRGSVTLRRAGIGVVMIVGVLTMGGLMGQEEKPTNAASDRVPDRVVTFETDRFHFTYRRSLSSQALVVTRAADQAYQEVQQWLGAPPVDRIVADLTEESHEHLGIAGWKKMRIDVRPPKSESVLVHVLYHETTHVLAAALSEGMPAARDQALRLFSEGLGEYVSYELLPDRGAERDEARRIAALAKSHFHLRFEDLLNPTEFLKRHDEYLIYALGEVWVAALVDTCGKQTPARVLRAFADPLTPQTLAGLDLWRHTLQQQHCDLDRVVGAFEKHLRRLEREAVVLPIASGTLVAEEEGDLVFELAVTAPTTGPFPVTVRVRADENTQPDDVIIETTPVSVGTPLRISIPPPDRLGKRLEFQVGAQARPGRPAFFTRWQSTTPP